MTYAEREIYDQLERGPYPGENFFRMKVSGQGETKTLSVSPVQLQAIMTILGSEG